MNPVNIYYIARRYDSSDGGIYTVIKNLFLESIKQQKKIKFLNLKRFYSLVLVLIRETISIKKKEVYVVHVHGMWSLASLGAYFLTFFSNVSIVVTPHGMLDSWALNNNSFIKKVFFNLIEKRIFDSAVVIQSLCENESDSIKTFYKGHTPIEIIPNGVRASDKLNHDFSVSDLDLTNDYYLYLGRLDVKKGVELLIESYINSAIDTNLYIAGWGDSAYISHLKELAFGSGKKPNIYFIGPRFGLEKEALFRSAKAFILPSYSEGLPMTVLESMYFECLTVVTPHCNMNRAVELGCIIETEADKAALTALYLDLESEYFDRSLLIDNAKRLVLDEYLWSDIFLRLNSYYEKN